MQGGFGRPSYWGGNATLPRVHQYRDLAVVIFEGHEGQPAFSHAWFPAFAFDAHRVAGRVALAQGGEGLLLLKGARDLVATAQGPSAGTELVQPGLRSHWIVRLGATSRHGDLDSFAAVFAALDFSQTPEGDLIIMDPDYGPVRFGSRGAVTAEGRELDPADWTVTGERRTLPDGPLRRPG